MEGSERRKNVTLIVFCWLVYTLSYLGKYSYNANINQAIAYYGVNHAEAGLVSTFFFFAYGFGQILHGFFSRKYNAKYVIFFSLIISATANIGIAFIKNFSVIKYLWGVNGFCLAVLWPVQIKLLSENLRPARFNSAVVVMGTTTAVGMILSYGLSALFIHLNNFRIIFYTAGIVLPVMAVSWFITYPFMTEKKEKTEPQTNEITASDAGETKVKEDNLILCVVGLGIFMIVANIVKDGLAIWLPSILIEQFGFNESLSVILSLVLPLFGILGCFLIVKLSNKIKNYLFLCTLLFAGILAMIALGWLGLGKNVYMLLLTGGSFATCIIYGLNNIIASKYPLQLKNKKNVGIVAGILNGLSYVGSTISSYGLGGVADGSGWNGVFRLFVILCACTIAVFVVLFGVISALSRKKR